MTKKLSSNESDVPCQSAPGPSRTHSVNDVSVEDGIANDIIENARKGIAAGIKKRLQKCKRDFQILTADASSDQLTNLTLQAAKKAKNDAPDFKSPGNKD